MCTAVIIWGWPLHIPALLYIFITSVGSDLCVAVCSPLMRPHINCEPDAFTCMPVAVLVCFVTIYAYTGGVFGGVLWIMYMQLICMPFLLCRCTKKAPEEATTCRASYLIWNLEPPHSEETTLILNHTVFKWYYDCMSAFFCTALDSTACHCTAAQCTALHCWMKFH